LWSIDGEWEASAVEGDFRGTYLADATVDAFCALGAEPRRGDFADVTFLTTFGGGGGAFALNGLAAGDAGPACSASPAEALLAPSIGCPAKGCPQPPQNPACGGFVLPHFGQTDIARDSPQARQKRAPLEFDS